MLLLLASDVPPLRQRLRLMFEQEGHQLVLAESPEIALAGMARHPKIDIVVSEWKFSEGTLMDLRRRSQQIEYITDDGNKPLSPHWIVLATPRQGQADSQRGAISDEIRVFGYPDVFEKPVNSLALLERVQAIGRERARPLGSAATPPLKAVSSLNLEGSHPLEMPAHLMSTRLAKLEEELAVMQSDNGSQSLKLQDILGNLRELMRQSTLSEAR